MAGSKPWLATELKQAIEMRRAGLTYKAIAEHFPGRTWEAVHCLLRDHGIKKPPRIKVPVEDPLVTATKALLGRMAANDVLAVLGEPCQPRIACAPFKTASMQRHNVAVQALGIAA